MSHCLQIRQHHSLRLLALEVPLILFVLLGCGAASTVQVTPTATPRHLVAIAPRAGSVVGFDGGSTQNVAFIDTSGHIRVLSYQAASGWQASDLTQSASAPVAKGSALAAFYDASSSTRNLVYTDTSGDIVLLSSTADGTWQSIKPGQTSTSSQPVPVSGGTTIAAIYNPTDPLLSKAIYYLGQNGHVLALYDDSAPGTVEWVSLDISGAASTTPFPSGSAIAGCALPSDTEIFAGTTSNVILIKSGITLGGPMQGHALACLYWQVDHSIHVFYLNSSGDLTELFVPHLNQPGGNIDDASVWHSNDWSSQVSAPRPASSIAAFQFTSNPAQPEEVAYIDGNGHVRLFKVDNNVYKVTVSDVTQSTNAPLAAADQGIAAYEWVAGASEHIVYVDGQNHLQQLSLTQGVAWAVTDLTTTTHLLQ